MKSNKPDRTVPRGDSVRNEFIALVRTFVEKVFKGDWERTYTAVASGGVMTRATLILIAERVDPKYVAKNWHIICQQVDLLDADEDGWIDKKEFMALNA